MGDRDINEARLRLLARYLGRQGAIARVDPFPSEKPDRIVAHLESTLFPAPIEAVRLEVRLRFNGELNVQYIETWPGERWACRWDRHENPHSPREHFHPPPTIDDDRAFGIDLPEDLTDVIAIVLRFVEHRIGEVWSQDDLVYPGEYEYEGDYGPEPA